MVTEKEIAFVKRWAKVREQEAGVSAKIVRGLPVAILFVLPILLLIIVVYIFVPEWYTKVAPKDPGTFFIIFLALMIAVVFIAYFRMQFNFEKNDELCSLIEHKLKEEATAGNAANNP